MEENFFYEDEEFNGDRKVSNVYLFNKDFQDTSIQNIKIPLANIFNGYCVWKVGQQPCPAISAIEICKEGIEYKGYISSIKAREYQSQNGSTIYYVRFVCHLIVDSEVVELFYDIPATISSKSPLTKVLIELGVPVFNVGDYVDLDCLISKPITATLKKSQNNGQDRFYIGEIKSRLC